MKRLSSAVVVAVAALGAAAAGVAVRRGLQRGAPGMNVWATAEPGERPELPHPAPGAPPLVPHRTSGMTVSREANDCLDCHLETIPASHSVNEFTKERREGGVAGMRWQCLQCHSSQTEAEPPIKTLKR
jgi:nitrate reductase cytochrome c-type subunit